MLNERQRDLNVRANRSIECFLLSIDITECFDSIRKKTAINSMLDIGVKEEYVKQLNKVYNSTYMQVNGEIFKTNKSLTTGLTTKPLAMLGTLKNIVEK